MSIFESFENFVSEKFDWRDHEDGNLSETRIVSAMEDLIHETSQDLKLEIQNPAEQKAALNAIKQEWISQIKNWKKA